MLPVMRGVPLVLVGLGLAGCGPGGPPPAGGVRGTVLFQGRPLAGGTVVFAPDRERGGSGKPVWVTVADDGTYTLEAPAGWYLVAVADPPGVDWEGHGWPRYPTALRRPDKSGLDREVLAGRVTECHFHVEAGD